MNLQYCEKICFICLKYLNNNKEKTNVLSNVFQWIVWRNQKSCLRTTFTKENERQVFLSGMDIFLTKSNTSREEIVCQLYANDQGILECTCKPPFNMSSYCTNNTNTTPVWEREQPIEIANLSLILNYESVGCDSTKPPEGKSEGKVCCISFHGPCFLLIEYHIFFHPFLLLKKF